MEIARWPASDNDKVKNIHINKNSYHSWHGSNWASTQTFQKQNKQIKKDPQNFEA